MDLQTIRTQIDAIDQEIVKLLQQRMNLMPAVAEYKQTHNLHTHQIERETELLLAKRKLAQEYGLNEEFVENISTLSLLEKINLSFTIAFPP